MWSQQADPPSPGGLCMEGSCSSLHFVETTFRNLCSRSFPPHCKRGETQLTKSSIVGLRPSQQRAQRPVCLPGPADREPTRAVAVTKSRVAGWAGPVKPSPPRSHLERPADMGLLCAHLGADMSLMFSNFFIIFFIQKQCNKWHFL